MAKQSKLAKDVLARLTAGLAAADDARRRNPSRYTPDGCLKPVCTDGQHRPFKDALACEVCGVAVFGPGSDVGH